MSLISQQIVQILLEDDVPVADQIENNMGLVYKVAKSFMTTMPGRRLDFDDLVSHGKIALIRALKGYDPSKGAFSTYAMQSILNDLRKVYAEQMVQSVERTTLDEPLRGDEDDDTRESGTSQVKDEDVSTDIDAALAKNETFKALDLALSTIADPRIRACLIGFKEGKTYRDLGAELGASQTMAANWTAKGLEQLRKFLVRTKKMSYDPVTGMLEDESDAILTLPENEARKKLDAIVKALKARAAKLSRSAV